MMKDNNTNVFLGEKGTLFSLKHGIIASSLLVLMACGGGSDDSSSNTGTEAQATNTAIVATDIVARSQISREKEIDLSESVVLSDGGSFSLTKLPELKKGEKCQLTIKEQSVVVNSSTLDDCIYEYEVQPKNAPQSRASTSPINTDKGYIRVSFARTYEKNTLTPIVKSMNYSDTDTLVINLIDELGGAIDATNYTLNDKVVVLGSGSAEVTADNQITYTAVGEAPYVNILYSYTKNDETEVRLGSISLAVSINPDKGVFIVTDLKNPDNYQPPVGVETIFDLDSYIIYDDWTSSTSGLQLVHVSSPNAIVESADPDDLTNLKFKFTANTPGTHYVTVVVTDHYGNFGSGRLVIYAQPDFTVIQDWENVTPAADYPPFASSGSNGKITFTAPLSKVIADHLNVNYTGTYFEEDVYGEVNDVAEVVTMTYPLAEQYCADRNARLPTVSEFNFLLTQEGSLHDGANQHNWPYSVNYWVADKPTSATARTVNLHTETQVNVSNAVNTDQARYVTCVIVDEEYKNYSVITPTISETNIGVKVNMSGQLLDPEGNPAPYQKVRLKLLNNYGYFPQAVAEGAEENENMPNLSEERRQVGAVETDGNGYFSFDYIDASFSTESILVYKSGQVIHRYVFDPEDIAGAKLDLNDETKWKRLFFESYYNGNRPTGVDLSLTNGIPLWNGSVSHEARMVNIYKAKFTGDEFIGRIKVQQEGNHTPALGRFVFSLQSTYDPNTLTSDQEKYFYGGDVSGGINSDGVINASSDEKNRSKTTPGLLANPSQLGFVYDYAAQHMSVYHGYNTRVDINGSEADDPASDAPGNLAGLRQSTSYLWFRYSKVTGVLRIYASQTPYRPETPLVSANNVRFGNAGTLDTNGFYVVLSSRISYRPFNLNTNPSYFEAVSFSSWDSADIE